VSDSARRTPSRTHSQSQRFDRCDKQLGRVIRGPDERGVRIVVGERFVPNALHSVYEYFPQNERDEFVRMTPDFLNSQFQQFWKD